MWKCWWCNELMACSRVRRIPRSRFGFPLVLPRFWHGRLGRTVKSATSKLTLRVSFIFPTLLNWLAWAVRGKRDIKTKPLRAPRHSRGERSPSETPSDAALVQLSFIRDQASFIDTHSRGTFEFSSGIQSLGTWHLGPLRTGLARSTSLAASATRRATLE